jgi:hypothetical protein
MLLARLAALLTGVALMISLSAGFASDYGTLQEAEALVKRAEAHYDKVGSDQAFADFAQNPGPFIDRDLYIVVYDMQANVFAHVNPKMVGRNIMDMRDPDGHNWVKERIDAARKQPSGYQDVKLFNPVTKRMEEKRVFWERHGNLLFASGAYIQ